MHAGHVIKCMASLNTSNSTKTQNIDMSYQTFFFPSRKLHPQRTAKYSTRNKANSFGSLNGKDCYGCGSNLKVKGGV